MTSSRVEKKKDATGRRIRKRGCAIQGLAGSGGGGFPVGNNFHGTGQPLQYERMKPQRGEGSMRQALREQLPPHRRLHLFQEKPARKKGTTGCV